jgi:hypothetical protein
MAEKNLGDLLLDENVVNDEDLESALAVQKKSGERLGSTLVRLGKIDESMLVRLLAEQHQVEGIDPRYIEPQPVALDILDLTAAMRLGALPLSIRNGTLSVALADPGDREIIAELEQRSNMRLEVFVAPQMLLYDAIKAAYSGAEHGATRVALQSAVDTLRQVTTELEKLLER